MKNRTLWDRAALLALPVYWVVLFVATHYPQVTIPKVPGNDKTIHVAAFGLLAFLYWQFARARRQITVRFVWGATVVLLVYSALDEYLQQFTGRFTDPLDFLADASGIIVVLAVLEGHRRWAGVAATNTPRITQ